MDSKSVSHVGQVVRIKADVVTVLLQAKSACGGCQAREKCGMADSSEREVDVKVLHPKEYAVGDEVKVSVKMSMGRLSVVLAYVLPLAFLISLMCMCELFSLVEWLTALLGLGGVAFYYFLLYLVRGKVEKKINFTITK